MQNISGRWASLDSCLLSTVLFIKQCYTRAFNRSIRHLNTIWGIHPGFAVLLSPSIMLVRVVEEKYSVFGAKHHWNR